MATSVNLSQVGDIILHLGATPPAGYISLGEGTSLSRTTYSELWAWAQENTTVISESAWQSAVSNQGSCAYFSSGDGSSTFRLPKLQSILKANSSGTVGAFNAAVYNNMHFHGLGKMYDNNGYWGRYAYSNATYPSGTAGYYWNGKGGHTLVDNPDYTGDVITSNNMINSSGASSSGVPTPATVNLMLCIRYTLDYQPSATTLDESAALAAVNELADAVSAAGTIAPELIALEDTGYILYSWGEMRQWGYGNTGLTSEAIAYPITFLIPPAQINCTIEDSQGVLTAPVTVNITNRSESGFTYKLLGADGQDLTGVRVRWQALGRA